MLESYDSFDNWKVWDFILRSNSKRRMIPVSWAHCCSQVWCVKRLTFCTWLQISWSTRLEEYDTAVLYLVTQSCPSLCDLNGPQPTRLLCPQQFSRQEYWSGLPCPPPGIFPTQGLKPGLPHYRQILYHLSHQGKPRILEWVAYPFSRGSSTPRNQTGVSCIADAFFTSWAIREAQWNMK